MKLLQEFRESPKKEKAKYLVSIGGMLVTGGMAVYFVIKAAPTESYQYMTISYFCFLVMLIFKRIPIKSLS